MTNGTLLSWIMIALILLVLIGAAYVTWPRKTKRPPTVPGRTSSPYDDPNGDQT